MRSLLHVSASKIFDATLEWSIIWSANWYFARGPILFLPIQSPSHNKCNVPPSVTLCFLWLRSPFTLAYLKTARPHALPADASPYATSLRDRGLYSLALKSPSLTDKDVIKQTVRKTGLHNENHPPTRSIRETLSDFCT